MTLLYTEFQRELLKDLAQKAVGHLPCYSSIVVAGDWAWHIPPTFAAALPPSHSRFASVYSFISLPCDSQVPTQPQAGSTNAGYWPAQNSGAREILLQLYREHLNSDGHSFLTKEELLQKCAQKTPRVVPESSRPWPALRGLLHRNLVLRTHRPARYALTPEGLELAQKLAEAEGLSTLNTAFQPEEHHEESPVPEAILSEPLHSIVVALLRWASNRDHWS